MSKKMMLLALVVASAAVFALPAASSAEEIHIEPGNQTFTIEGPAGELRAANEPTVTCEATGGSGTQTSATTGTMTLDFTGCHINVLGFTVKCRSAGSAADNTVQTAGSYHLITWNDGKTNFPAILVTPDTTIVTCAGTNIYVTGEVIGTITSPKCGEESKTLTLSFTATGTTQNHELWTGKTYDLKASTSSSHTPEVTAALVSHATIKSPLVSKLVCT